MTETCLRAPKAVISVGLVKTPDLDAAAGPWSAVQNSDTDPGYIGRVE
jgi:hypothetical protein